MLVRNVEMPVLVEPVPLGARRRAPLVLIGGTIATISVSSAFVCDYTPPAGHRRAILPPLRVHVDAAVISRILSLTAFGRFAMLYAEVVTELMLNDVRYGGVVGPGEGVA